MQIVYRRNRIEWGDAAGMAIGKQRDSEANSSMKILIRTQFLLLLANILYNTHRIIHKQKTIKTLFYNISGVDGLI